VEREIRHIGGGWGYDYAEPRSIVTEAT
jgi:hypothetical protein